MDAALSLVPPLPEWLAKDFLTQYKWPSWKEALLSLHHPEKSEDLDPTTPAFQRLAFDELLAHQLLLKFTKESQGIQKGAALTGTGTYQKIVRKTALFLNKRPGSCS